MSYRVLKLEILIQGHEDIEMWHCRIHKPPVSERPPSHFRHSLDHVSRKCQAKLRVHAFVKQDAHSFICSPANPKKR